MLAGDPHQFAHLLRADKRRRPSAPVQLRHRPGAIKQRPLQGDFLMKMIEIGNRVAAVFGDDLVAGAVEAHGIAERNMQIQRQGPVAGVTGLRLFPVLRFAEAIVELDSGRIGGLAGTGLVVLADQGGVKNDRGVHDRAPQGTGSPKK